MKSETGIRSVVVRVQLLSLRGRRRPACNRCPRTAARGVRSRGRVIAPRHHAVAVGVVSHGKGWRRVCEREGQLITYTKIRRRTARGDRRVGCRTTWVVMVAKSRPVDGGVRVLALLRVRAPRGKTFCCYGGASGSNAYMRENDGGGGGGGLSRRPPTERCKRVEAVAAAAASVTLMTSSVRKFESASRTRRKAVPSSCLPTLPPPNPRPPQRGAGVRA